jgi:hypothetical protein
MLVDDVEALVLGLVAGLSVSLFLLLVFMDDDGWWC